MTKATRLRLYKPDGGRLEFEVGTKTKEGVVEEVRVFSHRGVEVRYSNGSRAELFDFPFAVYYPPTKCSKDDSQKKEE